MRRPTYANVTASLALFVALGGTSYAVTKLPRNSVGSTQVRDGSLQTRDLAKAARSGSRGPRGAQGPVGAPGERGPSSVRIARQGPTVAMSAMAGVRREVRRLEGVPVGAWILRFDANAVLDANGAMHARCTMKVDGDEVVTSATVVGDAANGTREAGLPVETAVVRTTPFTVTVECFGSLAPPAGTALFILRPQIMAMQVADVTEAP